MLRFKHRGTEKGIVVVRMQMAGLFLLCMNPIGNAIALILLMRRWMAPVSYTHLTLPTICSV